MENEQKNAKKCKIKKIEKDRKRFKIKKIEYYEELDEINLEIAVSLVYLGVLIMSIIISSIWAISAAKEYGLRVVFVQSEIIILNTALAISKAIELVAEIIQKKILEEKFEESNDLLKAKETKKLVLSKNERNKWLEDENKY